MCVYVGVYILQIKKENISGTPEGSLWPLPASALPKVSIE